MTSLPRSPLLVVGVPRSGTTWVARVLAEATGADYVEEPDNHFRRPHAFRVKRALGKGEYPELRPGDEAPEYALLWRRALAPADDARNPEPKAAQGRRRLTTRLLAGATPAAVSAAIAEPVAASLRLRAVGALAVPAATAASTRPRIVKSVHAALALEWILERFDAVPLVVVRDPLNVLSSWCELGWIDQKRKDVLDELDPRSRAAFATRTGIAAPAADASPLARAAWLVGALTTSLLDAAERNPGWVVASHEALCESPPQAFRRLCSRLELPWSDGADELLTQTNRPGQGYEIDRVSSELPHAWRTRLSEPEAAEAQSVLEPFAFERRLARVQSHEGRQEPA